jgi:hypothetical protein
MGADNLGLEPSDFRVLLPPDSSGKGIHLVEVTLTDVNGVQFTAYQEVVTLADADGNPIAVTSQGRPRLLVTSPRQHETLEAVLRELQRMNSILLAGLRPEGTWDDDLSEKSEQLADVR